WPTWDARWGSVRRQYRTHGTSRPRTTSTSPATRRRTIRYRKPTPTTATTSHGGWGRRSKRYTVRTVERAEEPVLAKAAKSCRPVSPAAASRIASRSNSRGTHQARCRARAVGSFRVRSRYRYSLETAPYWGWKEASASQDRRTTTPSGRWRFNAGANRSPGMELVVSKATTWPRAWTPASVRPAAKSLGDSPVARWTAALRAS